MLQRWLTLFVDSSIEEVIQPVTDWINATHTRYTLLIDLREITFASGTTEYGLTIETSDDLAGPWRPLGPAFTSTIMHTLLISSDASDGGSSFDRYLRWNAKLLSGAAADWRICFQIKALPGNEAVSLAQTPRRM